MNAQEIIAYIGSAEKKTPVKAYVKERAPLSYGSAQVFGDGASKIVFGDWRELGPILADHVDDIEDCLLVVVGLYDFNIKVRQSLRHISQDLPEHGHTQGVVRGVHHRGEMTQVIERVADIAIDFSAPAALPAVAHYVRMTGTPLLSGVTGLSGAELARRKGPTPFPIWFSAVLTGMGLTSMNRPFISARCFRADAAACSLRPSR